jgi:hypothetical protein
VLRLWRALIQAASLLRGREQTRPARSARGFDLITCVHGLHYVGDKLGLLARVAEWLTDDGLFVADHDAASVRADGDRPAGRRLLTCMRELGFTYDPRRRRVSLTGGRRVTFPYRYVGADDRAGANYTGQPAVHSFYTTARPY